MGTIILYVKSRPPLVNSSLPLVRIQWWVHNSPDGGGANPRRGGANPLGREGDALLLFGQFSHQKTAWKWRHFDREGAARVQKFYYVDPPLSVLQSEIILAYYF